MPTSWAWPPDSRCGSRRTRASSFEPGDRLAGPLDRLGDRQPEVHRPDRDLLEDRRRDARSLGVRVLEADDDPLGELVGRHPGGRRPVERQRAPEAAADRGRGEPRRDEAERRLAGLVRPDEPDDLAVVEAEVDLVEDLGRVPGVAVGGPGQLERHGTSRVMAGSGRCPSTLATIAPTRASRRTRAEGQLTRGVRDPPEEMPPAGPPERPHLQGEAPLLHLGQRRQDHRPDERQEAAQPRPDAALRVEPARPLGAGDDVRPLDHRRDRLERGQGDEREPRRQAAALEVEDEAARLRRQPEQADRGRDREQPDEGLAGEVDALGGGVERADREQDVGPGPGEDADEDDRDRDRQASAGPRSGRAGRRRRRRPRPAARPGR